MPLVAAQCTNCGGTLQVDDSNDAAICQYCGTPFIVEKAVQNYQIHNSYQIQNANIIMNDDKSFEKRLASAEEYLYYLRDYAAAYKIYDEIEDIAPGNFKVWYGKICSRTMGFNVNATVEMFVNGSIAHREFERDIDSAYKTVSMEERDAFCSQITAFLNECKNLLQVKSADMNRVRQDLDNDINQRTGNINNLRRNVDRMDKKIMGMRKKDGKLYQRGNKLRGLKALAVGLGVLIGAYSILSVGGLNLMGYILYGAVGLIPLIILFIARIVARCSYRSNERKINHATNIRNQNNYEISEHNRRIQEDRSGIMELDNTINTCNGYITILDSVLLRYSA